MRSSTTPAVPVKSSWGENLHNLMDTRDNNRKPVSIVLLAIFLLGTLAVIVGGIGDAGYKIASALVWGFGFCVSGILLGFLFAIPRVLPAGAVIAPPAKPDEGGSPAAKASSTQAAVVNPANGGPSEINSNLVEVSDWLTKIIVGVGLVELKHLPAAAKSVAVFVAPSLGFAAGQGAPVVGGIMLFYSVHGFLGGYLLTRIYLAMILKWADNQVISQLPTLQLQSGDTIDVVDMLGQLQNRVGDVQKTVADLMARPSQSAEATAEAAQAVPEAVQAASRILWVDDIVSNNTTLVDSLKASNVIIDQALATDEAMRLLSANPSAYDLVITDMHRREARVDIPNAGIVLTEKIKSIMPELPVLIFCGRFSKQTFGAAAISAGARLVTASSTELLGEVKKILNAAGKSGQFN